MVDVTIHEINAVADTPVLIGGGPIPLKQILAQSLTLTQLVPAKDAMVVAMMAIEILLKQTKARS